MSIRHIVVVSLFLRKNLAVFLLLFAQMLFGQKPELTFEKTDYDFGTIGKSWVPPAVFRFTNTGDSKLAILLGTMPTGVKVDIPRYFIEPGKTDSVLVHYVPYQVGSFEEKIAINSNASDYPVYITIRGTATSVLECPNQNKEQSKKMFVQEIVVIDKVTRQSIVKASVNVESKFNQYSGKTNSIGRFSKEIVAGNYKIQIEADGYKPFADYKMINKNHVPLVYELEQETKSEEVAVNQKKNEETTTPLLSSSDVAINSVKKTRSKDKELPVAEYLPNNVVFLLDVSASMKGKTKIEFLKEAISQLVAILRDIDKVSLLVYNKNVGVLINGKNADNPDEIISIIDTLQAGGGTRGLIGLSKAYEVALKNFITNANNEVIIATDGEFESPEYSDKEMKLLIKGNAQMGIRLSVVGFGDNPAAKKRMKEMAGSGNGNYIQVDHSDDIRILIEEIKKQSKIEQKK